MSLFGILDIAKYGRVFWYAFAFTLWLQILQVYVIYVNAKIAIIAKSIYLLFNF